MTDVDATPLPPAIQRLIEAGRIREIPAALAAIERGEVPPQTMTIRRVTDGQMDSAERRD